jgi:LysR family transcriptional regulator for bpeEF and oprC
MSSMDLNQILTFVKVVDSGSFTKAAALLNQPKSRISRRIAALEKALGSQLLYRTTRQMQLTETGKDYYRRCAPLIQDLENANDTLTTKSEQLSGVLRVTAPEDYGKIILAPFIDEFLKIHPKMKVEVVLAGAYLDLIKEAIDIAIRIGNLKDASMKSKKLSTMKSMVVASPFFLEKNIAITKPEHLSQVSCIDFSTSDFSKASKSQWKLIKDHHQEAKVKIDGAVSANSPEFVYHLALLGRGVAMVPQFLCEAAIAEGKLIHLLKSWTSEPIPVHLLTPAQKEIPAKTRAFMDFLSAKLS